jgi:hypothetical protein
LPGPELRLVVAYRDGLEAYAGDQGGVSSRASYECAAEIAAVLAVEGRPLVVLGGTELTVLDADLRPLSSHPAPDDEPIRGIVALPAGRFVTNSDDETVRCWQLDPEGQVRVLSQWPVGCLPLLARPNGKSVLCSENGRLGERDPLTGTIVKSWPKTAPIVSAFADSGGHTAVTLDEDGRAALWDLHGRELLFAFSAPVRLHSGAFAASGAAGMLLSQDGDLLSFRVADGGKLKALPALPQPASDLAYAPSGELIALDENGGLWGLDPDQEQARPLGGAWAGWATSGLSLEDGTSFVGTASGELLRYAAGGVASGAVRAHGDAVVGLLRAGQSLLSIAADGSLALVPLASFGSQPAQELGDYAGQAVVSYHFEQESDRLWLALEEGKVVWLDAAKGQPQGEYQFPEQRIEELRPGGRPGEVLVLTDRGSLKRLAIGGP